MNLKQATIASVVAVVCSITLIKLTAKQPPARVPISGIEIAINDPPPKEEFIIPEEPDIILEDVIDVHCIALAIYGEARGETAEGMEWVAWVVKNRSHARNLRICDVLLQHRQFEPFRKGTELRRLAMEAKQGIITFPRMNNRWIQNKIHQIADDVYNASSDPTKGATHFWAPVAQKALDRNPPKWSSRLVYLRKVGNHRFYKFG